MSSPSRACRTGTTFRCTLCKTGPMTRDSLNSHIPGRKHKQAVAQQSYKKRNNHLAAGEHVMSIRSASKSLRPPRRMNLSYYHAPLPSTTVALNSESACRRDPDTLVCDDEDACGYIVEYNAKCDALMPDHYESLDRFGMPMTPIALEDDLREPTSSSPVVPPSRSHCTVMDLFMNAWHDLQMILSW
jgi:hypothetical protein